MHCIVPESVNEWIGSYTRMYVEIALIQEMHLRIH